MSHWSADLFSLLSHASGDPGNSLLRPTYSCTEYSLASKPSSLASEAMRIVAQFNMTSFWDTGWPTMCSAVSLAFPWFSFLSAEITGMHYYIQLLFVLLIIQISRKIQNLKCLWSQAFSTGYSWLWKSRSQCFLSGCFIPILRPRPKNQCVWDRVSHGVMSPDNRADSGFTVWQMKQT